MLVLKRREKEIVCIGHDIKVTILKIRRNQVEVGIAAPKEVAVHRKEIYDRIQETGRKK